MEESKNMCRLLIDDAEVLLDYCAGTLDREHAALLERHTHHCAECRNLVDAQKAAWSSLDDLSAPPVSADFDARIYARIAASEELSGWRKLRTQVAASMQWRPALAISAVAVGLLAIVVSRLEVLPPAPSPQISAVAGPREMDVHEIEQAERTLEDIEMLHQLGVANISPPDEPQRDRVL